METVGRVVAKLTDNPLYEVAKKELLSSALPACAPSHLAALLAAVQALVIDGTSAFFFSKKKKRPAGGSLYKRGER